MSGFARFVGPVEVRTHAVATTLSGRDAQQRSVDVTFVGGQRTSGSHASALPTTLNDACVTVAGERIAIEAREGHFDLSARAMHRHIDVGAAFTARIPPRVAPLGKRVFWRLVLALAGSSAGRRLLLRLRGR